MVEGESYVRISGSFPISNNVLITILKHLDIRIYLKVIDRGNLRLQVPNKLHLDFSDKLPAVITRLDTAVAP
jgi:hypothetical protein